MSRLVSMIAGNPVLLLWLALAAFVAGLVSGAGSAWYVQGQRLAATQARFDGFVATVAAEGKAAEKLAKASAAEDKRIKESSDREYQTTIARLDSDVKRMRDARASSRFVPAAPASSRRTDLACFDRAELERTIRDFDAEIQGLVDQGSADAVGLNVARGWAASIRAGTPLDSPANIPP